jgi:hypothetical protein
MIHANVQYLWVACICIDQNSETEKAAEFAKMHDYYREADNCRILIDVPEQWNSQDLRNDLRLLDHIFSSMKCAALTAEANLGTEIQNSLLIWVTERRWAFDISITMARTTGIELGVLNCYSTCISHVNSLFRNEYFTRVWTFQEMLLGKNPTMWGVNKEEAFLIGEFDTWTDLVINAKDKAHKLAVWIGDSRVVNTAVIDVILRVIEKDILSLDRLLNQVMGIIAARTDILVGGPDWWRKNPTGISNIFSATSIAPRECQHGSEIFKGLLGIFTGLFTAEEVRRELSGDDMERISFAFFKQLSIETGKAWTRLAITSAERGDWGWIPVVAAGQNKIITTAHFAGTINLGSLKPNHAFVKAEARTGLGKTPRKYMTIKLQQESDRNFNFVYTGCNRGQNAKTGIFNNNQIPTNDEPVNVVTDDTGRFLVQCATVLGSIFDPGRDAVEYRRKFLRKLQPNWNITDPNAKLDGWIDRCVSGTDWQNPSLKSHNLSINYRMQDITSCGSRLENENTSSIFCEVTVNCGCTFTAPYSWIFEAITSVEGSCLGATQTAIDKDGRILLQDGIGLVQIQDVGQSFNLIAFGGDAEYHKAYAASCRNTREDEEIKHWKSVPSARALVREGFSHGAKDFLREYGVVETGGSGNLLICRERPLDHYKIIGACIDEDIPTRRKAHSVTIK